jgi:hypothetical protein
MNHPKKVITPRGIIQLIFFMVLIPPATRVYFNALELVGSLGLRICLRPEFRDQPAADRPATP